MIEVRQVSKSFGNISAVNNLSFTVNDGELFVLLGTSGCGKTTTLKMINRLIEPDSGEILVNGKNIHEQPPEALRRRIGYVLQDTGLFPHYTIQENIAVVPGLLKWDETKTRARGKILLSKFNLSPDTYMTLYPDQLSGGQQQRVGFARALMANPPILLMDEPLGALDPVTRHQIRKEFKQLDELKNKTIVMVTHDISEAIELGDRICLMDKGSVQQIGPAAELLLHPRNDFVKSFFSHDRFMFQLKAFHIEDLLTYLEPVSSQPNSAVIETNMDLMETIEHLSRSASQAEAVAMYKINGQYYSITLKALLTAFQQKMEALNG